jgi:serine/threonine protein phosphatase 1
LSQAKEKWSRIPDGIRIYAIGDVHGRADLLIRKFERIDASLAGSRSSRPIHVLLGDYIDRGPASRDVIDLLIARSRTHELVCLRGNHESMLLSFLGHPAVLASWGALGGFETLASYGLAPVRLPDDATMLHLSDELGRVLPHSHRQFFDSLQLSFTCGDFFFAHAGVKPGVPLEQQKEEDLLCIRQEFLSFKRSFPKIVVHGHTPVMKPDVLHNRINIDTGAYATGRLTCLMIEGETLGFV